MIKWTTCLRIYLGSFSVVNAVMRFPETKSPATSFFSDQLTRI